MWKEAVGTDRVRRTSFFDIVTRRSVVLRASVMALVVGHVLAAINHGDRILTGTLETTDLMKIALTFLVPYSVSTFSSVLAVREQERAVGSLRGAGGGP